MVVVAAEDLINFLDHNNFKMFNFNRLNILFLNQL
jgi:hypothetical protein